MSEELREVEAPEEVVEEKVEEVATDVVEDPVQEQQLSLNDLVSGYVVGLTEDGNFIFEPIGKKKELLPLLGLNGYASRRLANLLDKSQMSGDTLVHEVGKALNLLNQKVDAIGNALQQALNAGKSQNDL